MISNKKKKKKRFASKNFTCIKHKCINHHLIAYRIFIAHHCRCTEHAYLFCNFVCILFFIFGVRRHRRRRLFFSSFDADECIIVRWIFICGYARCSLHFFFFDELLIETDRLLVLVTSIIIYYVQIFWRRTLIQAFVVFPSSLDDIYFSRIFFLFRCCCSHFRLDSLRWSNNRLSLQFTYGLVWLVF